MKYWNAPSRKDSRTSALRPKHPRGSFRRRVRCPKRKYSTSENEAGPEKDTKVILDERRRFVIAVVSVRYD